jgi:hypothetical protein
MKQYNVYERYFIENKTLIGESELDFHNPSTNYVKLCLSLLFENNLLSTHLLSAISAFLTHVLHAQFDLLHPLSTSAERVLRQSAR